MLITRNQRCFERWDEIFEAIVEAAWRSAGVEALTREFEIPPREQDWFMEWIKT